MKKINIEITDKDWELILTDGENEYKEKGRPFKLNDEKTLVLEEHSCNGEKMVLEDLEWASSDLRGDLGFLRFEIAGVIKTLAKENMEGEKKQNEINRRNH